MSRPETIGGLIAAALIIATLAVFGVFVLTSAERSKSEPPVYGQVPAFEFINQDSARFGHDDLLGKVTVVDFFFTSCRSICPAMAVQMEKLYRTFDDSGEFQLVSISVDPGHDSPDVLKTYAVEHGVRDRRWQFLNGPAADVIALSELGFMLPADNLPMGHSPRFALVDRRGQIRGFYNSLEDKPMIALREQITRLLIDTK